jgi:hypothetical protein
MRVIVGCEFSQIVCKAFRARGHEAYSCDLDPTEGNPAWHIQDDVLNHLNDGWDLGIFHDPCTYQCNSGVQWLHTEQGRWDKLTDSCEFTKKLFNAPIKRICRENPIPHKYAVMRIGKKYDQIIQPWMFGHYEKKATCLWLKNLPKLIPEYRTTEECRISCGIPAGIEPEQRIFKMSPNENRGKDRSRFFPGIANAMAEQWG